jgi:protein disulfide-isomerase A1
LTDSTASSLLLPASVVVSYTTSGKAPEAFTKFASSARDSYLFGHTASKSVLSAESITADQIVLYKSFDEPFLSLPGDLYKGLTAEKLGLWVKENAVPTLGEISPENFGTYAQAGKPIAYVFVDPNESNEALLKSLEPLAKTHKSELSWVFIDGIKFVDHAKSLNVDVASWPRFVVQDLTLQAKYPLKTSVTAANVKSFVEEYLAGDVAPDVKSAKVKEVQDESVWDLATDEYEQVVWEDGKDKDVFVEFFAPWCGHCKKLKPIWDTLGDKYADVPSVLIAKFDATENDVPPFEPFKIQGFPTLKFRPAGSDEWVDYSGDRSLESLVEFLEENAASDLTVKNVSKRATAETVVEKGTEAADTIVDKAGEAYDAAVEKGEEVVEAVKSTGEQVVRKVREEL